MSYYQKFITAFTGRRWVLLLTAGFFTLTSMTQDHVNFSGEWKLNESKSEIAQFPLCIFGGDRMRSKTMKIASQADFLTVDVARPAPGGMLLTRQEKLTFDGKESEATYVGTPREKSAARWSDDGQTMTVNSVRSFDPNGKTADFKVIEVWKLFNGGKSISIQVISSSLSGDKTMKLVYDKQWTADQATHIN
jgi:hypothetical protein